jgi:DNA-binding transcriptional regulator LsrR (DeoR family)
MTKQMQKRNARIKKMYKTGKYSVRELATKIGLSKSRVGEIILG